MTVVIFISGVLNVLFLAYSILPTPEICVNGFYLRVITI
jgi:hypothetical protein